MERPKITRQELILKLSGLQLPSVNVMIVGIRGYYKNSMGKPGENDRGIYDDAAIIMTPDQFFTFNFNTDPSKFQNRIATLQPGIYWYKKGLHGLHHLNLVLDKNHKPVNEKDVEAYDWLVQHPGEDHPDPHYKFTYWAFRQDSNVTVKRDGGGIETDSASNRFWIDIHRGGEWSTSSAGCQTFIEDQWVEARQIGYAAMDKYQQDRIPYILIEN